MNRESVAQESCCFAQKLLNAQCGAGRCTHKLPIRKWANTFKDLSKKNLLKPTTTSHTTKWYTVTDGFLEHPPSGGSLSHKGPTLQKIIPFWGCLLVLLSTSASVMVHLYLEGIPCAPPWPWEFPPLLLATCTLHGGPKCTFENCTLRSRAGSSWPAREQSSSVLNFPGCLSFSELLWLPFYCTICHSPFSSSTLSQK